MNWWQRFKRSDAHTQANIVCTAIIMLATIAYAFISARQLATMRDTLAEMKRSGEQSTQQVWSAIGNLNWMARSTDQSQKVSQKSIEAIIKQNHLDQRAWVSVTEISGPPEVGKPWDVKIIFRNTGKTIARDLRIRFGVDDLPGEAEPPVGYRRDQRFSPPTILSPGSFGESHQFPGSRDQGHPNVVSQEIFDAHKKGTMRLSVFGILLYRDIFGGHHRTDFCDVYRPSQSGFYPCEKGKNTAN
ncbi:MAG: hypothetical protein WBD67_04530 [Terracidiphilus sp.]